MQYLIKMFVFKDILKFLLRASLCEHLRENLLILFKGP